MAQGGRGGGRGRIGAHARGRDQGRGRGRGRGRGSGLQARVVRLTDSEKLKLKEKENAEIGELEARILEQTPAKGELPTDAVPFADMPISAYTKKGLQSGGYATPTQIQLSTIPHALAGRDVLGAAKTGSGKTVAFLVPLLERLFRARWSPADRLGALVISPTRELAMQIFEVLRVVGKAHSFSAGLVVGGKELKEEQGRVPSMNIVVCTPGRLLQHFEQTPGFDASNLEMLVLDEADRILDMGFAPQLNSILGHLPGPEQRQTLLFSATQTKSVKDLARLSLKDPEFVGVHEKAATATPESLKQSYMVCDLGSKLDILWSFIKTHLKCKVIVFLATCRQVRFVHEAFCKLQPGVPLMCLHGKVKPDKRTLIYYDFVNRPAAVLFATDIAARGLDFPAIDWVFQMDCPEDTAMYIHRAGRTARYNKGGKALLLLLPNEEETVIANFKESKIPIEKINANPKKLTSLQGKMASLTAEYKDLRLLAQKAFMSYVRSVYLMPSKEIFDVSKLPMEEYAHSLGLMGAPRIEFLTQDLSREKLREKKNVNKKLEALRAKAKAEKERKKLEREKLKRKSTGKQESSDDEEDDDSMSGHDSYSDNDDGSGASSTEDEEGSSEEEDQSDSEKESSKRIVRSAKTNILPIATDEDGNDELLVVKRKRTWSSDDEDGKRKHKSLEAMLADGKSKKKKVKKIRIDGPVNANKVVFSDSESSGGEEDLLEDTKNPPATKAKKGSLERLASSSAGAKRSAEEIEAESMSYAQMVAARLKAKEREDLQRERERVRAKHLKKRLKEKGPKAEDDDDGVFGAQLAVQEEDEDDQSAGSSQEENEQEESEGNSSSGDSD